MSNNNNNNKPTKAQRAAQSARDKQAQKNGGQGKQQRGQKQPKQRAPRKQKQVAAAAAYATGLTSGGAKILRMGLDSCRIVHRELIASVTGSVAFAVASSFALNPGIAATFPWLAIQAQGWERYKFNSLKFCYYTRTGSNVPGSVMLAPDYDPADAAPASEQIASSFEDTTEDAPWKDQECVLRPHDMVGGRMEKYVRVTALAANLDIKTYDSGNLHLCTVDGTAVPWGKLWVEYDVTFFTPQLPPAGAPQALGGRIFGNTATTAANPLGTAPTVDPQALGIAVDATSTITFATPGEYLVSATLVGTVITADALTAGANATVTSVIAFIVNGAGTLASQTWRVETTVANATVAFTATATTITAAAVSVGSGPLNSYA